MLRLNRFLFRHYVTKPISEFASSYDFLYYNFQADDNPGDTYSSYWNKILDQLVEEGSNKPMFTDSHKLKLVMSVTYRNQIHPGNDLVEVVEDYKQKLDSRITDDNLDSFILRACRDAGRPDLSLGYLNYIETERGKRVTLSQKSLVLEAAARSEQFIHDPDVESRIIQLAKNVFQVISDLGITDDNNYHIYYVIGALSNSKQLWKSQALDLYLSHKSNRVLEDIEERTSVTSVSTGLKLIRRVLEEGQGDSKISDTLWKIMNHKNFLTDNVQSRYRQNEAIQQLHDKAYITFMDHYTEHYEQLFDFFKRNDVLISWEVARKIKAKLEELDDVTIGVSQIKKCGVCELCDTKLEEDEFSQVDFKKLKTAIFNKCLKKTDIYLSSVPKEVEKFEKFSKKLRFYDVVVDGLNVALSHLPKFNDVDRRRIIYQPPYTQGQNILGILKTLKNRGMKKILLIYRPNIYRLPHYKEIAKECTIYTANRESEDDPFVILATLFGGPNTLFVSNDRLRQHNYVLENSELQRLFTRWQISHQLFHKIWATPRRTPLNPEDDSILYRYNVTERMRYRIKVQDVDDSWHLPIVPTYDQTKGHMAVPKDWLCIRKN